MITLAGGRLRTLLTLITIGCALLLSLPTLAASKIAIIIDDLGYNPIRGEQIMALPAAITCAVIPQSPHAVKLATRADNTGKEVILHMPMETDSFAGLDAGGLHRQMKRNEFGLTLAQAVTRIPQARGLNNHMGGILTADRQAMSWLMEELALHNLFFIDSRTTAQSVATELAQQQGLAFSGRDIFLDNERDLAAINRQFNATLALAHRRGHAIVIGHPYPETISYLQSVLPLLEQAGIKVVPVSTLLTRPPVRRQTAASDTEQEPGNSRATSDPGT